MTTEEVREKIVDILHRHYYPTTHENISDWALTECAEEILTLLEIAVVDREAKLPDNPYAFKGNPQNLLATTYEAAQKKMVKQGWVKEMKK